MKDSRAGFTLIEFIVIITIFAIMAAVALFNFQGFRSDVGLSTLTQDIALTIRQAQVAGWSTLTNTIDPQGESLRTAQGIYFTYDQTVTPPVFGQEGIILYTTPDATNAYYDPIDSVIVDTVKIQGISRIIDIQFSEDKQAIIDGVGTQVSDHVSLAFTRPFPEPIFFDGSQQYPPQYVGIYINGSGTATPERIIIISPFGEIEVQSL